MILEKDFVWHIKKENNISVNPIQAEYCIIDFGYEDGKGKLYSIERQYPQDEHGLKLSDEPELYILYESSCKKTNISSYSTYGEYELLNKHLVRVFKTLEEAKKRAFVQYSHIYHYVMPEHIKKTADTHFIVK